MSIKPENLLLEALTSESREHLLSRCEEMELPIRMMLQQQDARPKHAYFLTSGFASVVVHLPEGSTAEVALVGREGVVGSLAVLGPSLPSTECFMQLAGRGYQMPFSDFEEIFRSSEDVRGRVLEAAQVQAMATAQLTACNKLHDSEARLARWLLMVRDRTDSEVLSLTQEFLAEMLGTRRTTVALAAGSLQQAGFIKYSRGKVRILSAENLADAACDCYPVVKRLNDGLYRSKKR